MQTVQCRRGLQCSTAPSASGTRTNCVQNWLRLRRLCAVSASASKLHSGALVRIESNWIESEARTRNRRRSACLPLASPLLSSRLLTLTTQVSPHRSHSHLAKLLSHRIALSRADCGHVRANERLEEKRLKRNYWPFVMPSNAMRAPSIRTVLQWFSNFFGRCH